MPDGSAAPQRLSVRARRLLLAGAAAAGTALVGGTVNFLLPSVLGLGQQPLSISVEDDPGAISTFADEGQILALPTSASGEDLGDPQAQGCSDFHRWGQQFGAVDSGSTPVRVTVQGNAARPVLLSQIRVRILQRENVTEGAYVACATAGDASIRPMSVDLDAVSTIVQPAAGKAPFGVTVGQGEIEVFDVEASTRAQGVATRWALELTLTSHGRTQVVEVQDRGHPFETVGPPPSRARTSSWLTGWSPGPPFH